jgi:hypothetical protein
LSGRTRRILRVSDTAEWRVTLTEDAMETAQTERRTLTIPEVARDYRCRTMMELRVGHLPTGR